MSFQQSDFARPVMRKRINFNSIFTMKRADGACFTQMVPSFGKVFVKWAKSLTCALRIRQPTVERDGGGAGGVEP